MVHTEVLNDERALLSMLLLGLSGSGSAYVYLLTIALEFIYRRKEWLLGCTNSTNHVS